MRERVKILAIGNSFSDDAMAYLWDILRCGGVEEVTLGNLCIGGCSVERHAQNIVENAPDYMYMKNTCGVWQSTPGTTLAEGLADEAWDIITLQQASHDSGIPATYARQTEVLAYVNRHKRNPEAILYWHATWAYQGDSTHWAFPRYGCDQNTMHAAIRRAVAEEILPRSEYAGVIDAGAAIQYLRSTPVGDTVTRDGFHMSESHGRYTVALTWAQTLCGVDPDTVTWLPEAFADTLRPDLGYVRAAVRAADPTNLKRVQKGGTMMKHTTDPVGLSTCGQTPSESFFVGCHEAGITHVEISDSVERTPTLDLPALVSLAAEHGVTVASLHLPFSQEMDISLLDPVRRGAVVAYQLAVMEKAAAAGIPTLVIHPSSEPISEEERAARMEKAKESLDILADRAVALGVTLAVENLPRTCLGNCSRDMLELLSAHPALRSCLDTNHLLTEDTAAYVRRVGDRVVTTHVSDFDFVNERHWLPGEGKQDFLAILEALREVGYAGPWLYELGLGTPRSIVRPRELTYRDIAENAATLLCGERPEALGTPIEGLGMWA